MLAGSLLLLLVALATGVAAAAQSASRREAQNRQAARRLAHIGHPQLWHHGTCLDCLFDDTGSDR